MRLPALEKNILIYRALQIAQFLFYAESLRKQIVSSVGRSVCWNEGQEIKGAKLLKRIFKRLEKDQSITSAGSTELQDLLELRNKIAHDVHLLTGDIEIPGRNYRFRDYLKLQYDYEALGKIKKWYKELLKRLPPHYVLTAPADLLLFEAAERAYEKELTALRRRIDRQFLLRKKKLENRRT